MSKKMDVGLTAREEAALKMHYAICVACKELGRQFEFIRNSLSTLFDQTQEFADSMHPCLSAEAKTRMKTALQ